MAVYVALDRVSGLTAETAVDTGDGMATGYLEVGPGLTSLPDQQLLQMDFGSSVAMASTDFSFSCCARFEGDGDQLLFANGAENATDWHALYYDASEGELVYARVIGVTFREVRTPIITQRMYHIVATCDYDGSTNTTMSLYLDGLPVKSSTFAGAPDVTNDDLLMLESGGSPSMQFNGIIAAPKFYSVAMTAAEITAQNATYEAFIESRIYATQTITATDLDVNLTGEVLPNPSGGAAFLLYQAEDGGMWRAANITPEGGLAEYISTSYTGPLNAFRLMALGTGNDTSIAAFFDEIDGGSGSEGSLINIVEIPENKRKALEELILARKPLHSWAVMVVRYV